ncbi:MAG: homocysteine S-methyltransferase [Planctomycetes bacterium]|nr:homocysteine S-methyltransferase [Planctomycetota bacterium]
MQDPQKLIERFKSRVHVLDGGLATELEKRGHDISGKLWSAKVLLEDPGAIEQLHYDYLKAGADIIITSSYQLTFQGMKQAGYTHEQAEDALWKSVEVAVKARKRYLGELDEDLPEDRKPLIAASIGPYGAYLADGSEYTGNYGLSSDQLAEFHRERFEFLVRTEADFIAIETIPTAVECEAFFELLREHRNTPAWLSYTCETGVVLRDGTELAEAIKPFNTGPRNVVAIGLNCMHGFHMTGSIATTRDQTDKPIVAYPNSGEVWDAESRCWIGRDDLDYVYSVSKSWVSMGVRVIGGCCRTGPEHIAQLRALVDELNQSPPC